MDVQEVQQGQQYRIFLNMTFNNETWIHYVYRNGGLAPNIVPDKASLYYFIRSREENMKEAVRIQQLGNIIILIHMMVL